MAFDPLAHARAELAPLVRALVARAAETDEPEQRDFFARVLAGLEGAADDTDLAAPFMELSTSAFLGFRFDATTSLLLDQALARAQLLSETLALAGEPRH